jgi:hypothetical protein
MVKTEWIVEERGRGIENMELRRAFGPKTEIVTGGWRKTV